VADDSRARSIRAVSSFVRSFDSLRWTEIDRRRAATSPHAGASPARSSTSTREPSKGSRTLPRWYAAGKARRLPTRLRPRCCQRHAGLPSRKRRGSSCWPLSSTVVRMARTRSSKPETRVRFSHRGQRDVRAVMPHGEARPDTFLLLDLGSGVLGMDVAVGPIPTGSSDPPIFPG
jgi:hypothetical protein